MVYNGNPIKMDDLGVPLFLERPIYFRYNLELESQPVLHGWMLGDSQRFPMYRDLVKFGSSSNGNNIYTWFFQLSGITERHPLGSLSSSENEGLEVGLDWLDFIDFLRSKNCEPIMAAPFSPRQRKTPEQ